ncbi:probable non-specific lipid-transfer protein 3 [Sesamum indicum]|uniref:Probable non-specific lipid-transfer protein 3 n=1 Tax=Sesamum indicum TaxID=4182 RepID=A0A6I9UDM0_SESIN|nr:probable non-specific lipid-transfer protein 3 [Sesamum indicum]
MSKKLEFSAVWVVGLLVLAVGTSQVSAISCLDAITRLMPCQSYLLGFSSSVSVQCCQGAASLNQLVGSDRGQLKPLCQCLKQTAVSIGVNVDRAKQLPQLCKITVPVPIDPNVNCDSL